MATKTKVSKRLSKPEKVTNEELNKMQNLVDGINRSKITLGSMEMEKHRTLHNIAGLEDQIRLFREEMKKSYGTDNVSIDTGIINYEDEQTDKKD